MHLVGFIIRICHDVRSSECQMLMVCSSVSLYLQITESTRTIQEKQQTETIVFHSCQTFSAYTFALDDVFSHVQYL